MKIIMCLFSFLCLTVQTSFCFSKETINISIIPDFVNCNHHFGVEFAILENSTLGILGTNKCTSDRPTYGDSNSNVNNTFSRIYIPWRYSFDGAFKDSWFIQTMIGMENSEFQSEAGSVADVTFIDLTLHGGHQWFWANGFNVSTLAGVAYLKKTA